MEMIGYVAAVLIGISLGLIGGGGSILTVPVLVYLFSTDAMLATSYSLFIVGISSMVGAYKNYINGQVSVKTALLFGASSVSTVYITRKFILPYIPQDLFTIGDIVVTKPMLTMVLFAILMLLASVSMIRGGETIEEKEPKQTGNKLVQLTLYGIAIGLVTGFLGAGGGFLLIPALVVLLKMSMKKAVGTSLLIIALNSLIGFAGDIGQFHINWPFLLIISSIAVVGIFIGSALSKKIPGDKLKKGFGWFVLIMGLYILTNEFFLK